MHMMCPCARLWDPNGLPGGTGGTQFEERAVIQCQVQYQRFSAFLSLGLQLCTCLHDHLDSPAPGLHFTHSTGRAEAHIGALGWLCPAPRMYPTLLSPIITLAVKRWFAKEGEIEAGP